MEPWLGNAGPGILCTEVAHQRERENLVSTKHRPAHNMGSLFQHPFKNWLQHFWLRHADLLFSPLTTLPHHHGTTSSTIFTTDNITNNATSTLLTPPPPTVHTISIITTTVYTTDNITNTATTTATIYNKTTTTTATIYTAPLPPPTQLFSFPPPSVSGLAVGTG